MKLGEPSEGSIMEEKSDPGRTISKGVINPAYIVTEVDETTERGASSNGTVKYDGSRRQSDTGRRIGVYYKTHPEELAKLQEFISKPSGPSKDVDELVESIELGTTRLRKISKRSNGEGKTSTDMSSAENSRKTSKNSERNGHGHGPVDRKESRREKKASMQYVSLDDTINPKERKISAYSHVSFDETADGAAGDLYRNGRTRASAREPRKISAFQKAIETIAHVHVDVISLREGSILEMFVPKKSPQILAAMAATIGAFGMGTVMAWSSPALPQLETSETLGHPSNEELSWIASLVPLAGAFAGPPTGRCIQSIGRKPTMIAISAPFLIGWLLIAFATNIYMVLAGRFLTGYCAGAISLTAPVFISETAEDSIRGILGSGFHLMITLGILFSYVVGALVDWQWLAMISGGVPVLMCLIMLYVPASPRYLITRGRVEDATKALMWFRGATTEDQVQEELDMIVKAIDDTKEVKVNFSEFLTPGVMKPLSVSIGLMIFQSFSGADAITFYTVSIFHEAGSSIDGRYATIIVGAVQVLATLLSLAFVEKAGRRGLLLSSDVFMAVAHAGLGAYFFFEEGELRSKIGFIPLISLILFVIAYSFGFGPVPWMMMGEVLPHHVIGPASAIATSFNWFCAFLLIRFFEEVKDDVGPNWCYIGFAVSCVLGFIFVYFLVPETKGKSLDEIQQLFSESKGMGIKKAKKKERKISRTTVDSYFFA